MPLVAARPEGYVAMVHVAPYASARHLRGSGGGKTLLRKRQLRRRGALAQGDLLSCSPPHTLFLDQRIWEVAIRQHRFTNSGMSLFSEDRS
jgi:hypothetical protein